MENNYIKVKDKNYLVRDPMSNGILNTDENEYKNYIENYKKKYQESKKINDFEDRMNSMQDDLNEIKSLLKELLK